MNTKWLLVIVIILVVGVIAVQLFVPQKIDLADGTVKIFGNDNAEPAPVDTTTQNTPTK